MSYACETLLLCYNSLSHRCLGFALAKHLITSRQVTCYCYVLMNASALLNQAEGFRHQESSILCQIDV